MQYEIVIFKYNEPVRGDGPVNDLGNVLLFTL